MPPSVTLPGTSESFSWRSDEPPPSADQIQLAGDQTTAQEALRRLNGHWLLYRGNYKNARQLLAALGRRLERRRDNAKTPLDLLRAERTSRQHQHDTLSRLLVELDAAGRLSLREAPDLGAACRWRWGPDAGPSVVPLRELVGVVGAHEWYRKGLEVAGLPGRLHPHYGVFTPTRGVYPELLQAVPDPTGKLVFDIGTGTGVLAFLLLARGAARAIGTDIDPAAVASAREDGTRLGLGDRFEAQALDLFPAGRADLVVCNPPWLPEPIRGRLDAAVFDPENRFLRRFLEGLPAHLAPNGLGCLLISNLAELLGLRPEGFLEKEIARSGLQVSWKREAPASHPRSQDAGDRLHAVRSREVVTLYGLTVAPKPPG